MFVLVWKWNAVRRGGDGGGCLILESRVCVSDGPASSGGDGVIVTEICQSRAAWLPSRVLCWCFCFCCLHPTTTLAPYTAVARVRRRSAAAKTTLTAENSTTDFAFPRATAVGSGGDDDDSDADPWEHIVQGQ